MTPFLLFDAYGTLVELDDFYGRLQRGFMQHGVALPADVVTHAAHCEMKYYIVNTVRARTQEDWLALRRECAQMLAAAIREQGYPLALTDDTVLQVMSDALVFRVFPETQAVLEELQRRCFLLGVLSNWDCHLPVVLQELKLDVFFRFILTSAEVGIQKPALEFFEQGLQRAREVQPGLLASECFYIGDHYESDVLGARAAGLTPLWLVRDVRDLASGSVHEAEDTVVRLQTLRNLLEMI